MHVPKCNKKQEYATHIPAFNSLNAFATDYPATVNLALPLARRAANTFLPFLVAILARKPCLFFCFLLEG